MNMMQNKTIDFREIMSTFPAGSEINLRDANWETYEEIVKSVIE